MVLPRRPMSNDIALGRWQPLPLQEAETEWQANAASSFLFRVCSIYLTLCPLSPLPPPAGRLEETAPMSNQHRSGTLSLVVIALNIEANSESQKECGCRFKLQCSRPLVGASIWRKISRFPIVGCPAQGLAALIFGISQPDLSHVMLYLRYIKHPTVPGAPLSFATIATRPDQNPKNLHVEHRDLFGVITTSWL